MCTPSHHPSLHCAWDTGLVVRMLRPVEVILRLYWTSGQVYLSLLDPSLRDLKDWERTVRTG